jgi:3-hydroxyacyl-CoA dehydrogenase
MFLRTSHISQVMRRSFSTKHPSLANIKKVGVVGLGLMGHGVAQMAAQAGYSVYAIEAQQGALDTGLKRIESSLGKVVARDVKTGKRTEEEGKAYYAKVMGNIQPTTNVAQAHDCDLIIEAIAENRDLKLQFYKALGPQIKPSCIFASNTSSLQITEMGVASNRPKNFVGLHFFNPVQMMKLVEVIKTEHTDDDVYTTVTEFGKDIGKTTVSCGDTPGFIVNRLLVPYLTSAMEMVDRNDASIEDIDVSMKLGAGHPMGPLHLSDYIGLDTIYSILEGWRKLPGGEKFPAMPLVLEKLYEDGEFGRKSGKGFYNWDGDKIGSPRDL